MMLFPQNLCIIRNDFYVGSWPNQEWIRKNHAIQQRSPLEQGHKKWMSTSVVDNIEQSKHQSGPESCGAIYIKGKQCWAKLTKGLVAWLNHWWATTGVTVRSAWTPWPLPTDELFWLLGSAPRHRNGSFEAGGVACLAR
jgi:hypothetical protein